MSDDLAQRLGEARDLFVKKDFEGALKVLAACPQDDPKVVHNTAMCKAAVAPGNYRATIARLELPPIQRVKSLKTGTFTPMVVLAHEGQELAFLNAAVLLLHNGAVVEARNALTALANVSGKLSPSVRMRVAALLHVATRRSAVDVSDLTSQLTQDIGKSQDAAVQQLLALAYSDTSGLHGWYASSSKSPVERALYLNNLGVEAFADGKGAVAGVFFARASQACKDDVCPFVASSIAYNSAVCSISRGAAEGGSGAIQALMVAQKTMSGSPMLWLRLAQALLDRFHANVESADAAAFDAEVEQRVAAIHQGQAPAFPAIPPYQVRVPASGTSLINATAQALQNALALLIERNERLVDAARRLSQNPETALALDSVLCNLAYVELTRGNYGVVVALATEYNVMERDVRAASSPRTQAVMACYHVEALCCANRLAQALRMLQSMNLGHFVAAKSPNASIEALMLNVCTAYIVSGQWTKALQLSQQLVSKLPSPVAQLLVAYLELARGNAPGAADIVATLPQRNPAPSAR